MFRTARQRSARAARRRRFEAAPPEALESRALLSATGGTRVITAADSGAVTVDTTEFSSVLVTAGADIGTLTIQGSECDVKVDIEGAVSSLNVQGGSGAERVLVREGAEIGTVTFNSGSGGIGKFRNAGLVTGSLTFNGGADTDLLRIQGNGEVRGGISGNLGGGRDGFDMFDSAVVDNVSLDLGDGDDRADFDSSETTTGNLSLTTGDGEDAVQFREGFGVGGNQTVDTGDGDDLVITYGYTVEGDQTFNVGGGSDRVFLGGDTIEGGSFVNYMDAIEVREDGEARDIQSQYEIVTQGGTGEALVLLEAGSAVGGNLIVNTFGESIVRLGLTVEMGNATVNTGTGSGSGADTVILRDGTAIGGNFTATLGGSEADADRFVQQGQVLIGDRDAGTNGNFNVATGGGADTFISEQLIVNGNQTLDLGATPEDEQETVRFDGDLIDGSSSVEAGGGLNLVEVGRRRILGDYSITAGAGESRVALDRGTQITNSGNLTVTAGGPLRLNSSLTVGSGNVTINAGAGDDVLNLQRSTTEGNLSVNGGAGDDLVRFGRSTVVGNLNVSGSGGNDRVRNGDIQVVGTASYNGGSGNDDRIQARPEDAQISGFEN